MHSTCQSSGKLLANRLLALEAGFNSQNAFYNQFKKRCGTTPSRFRSEHFVANPA